jgi:hypothetical protein
MPMPPWASHVPNRRSVRRASGWRACWASGATQTQFSCPSACRTCRPKALELPDIEAVALAQRLDVQGAKLAAEQTAKNLGLTRTTRFINVLELGLVRNSSNEEPTAAGWEIGFELPLFDWGGARVARAEAIYMQTAAPRCRDGDQRPLRSARGLHRLPLGLRHRAPSA